MNKFKKYSFWVALTGAVVVFIQTILRGFGVELNTEIFESIILSFCGVLVVLGILVKDSNINSENKQNSDKENNTENKDDFKE